MAYITLNKKHFFNNLDIIAKQTKGVDKIALVLKDNAYGHGILEISEMAKSYGVTKAVVKSCSEAERVKDFFEYILVLADYPNEQNSKIRYTINSIESIKKFPKSTKVELKVDSGMHRNGIAKDELESAFEEIQKYHLKLEAIFTHHRSADELSSEWFWQNEQFETIKKRAIELAKEFNIKDLRFHSDNSASLLRRENFNQDMARVGIGAYGCLESSHLKEYDLKPILSLHVEKISSRDFKCGSAIGYGASYILKKDSTVSNYNFGYGDGFLRVCSNNYITPNQTVQVGRISMDSSSFISDEKELLLFDDAREVAKGANTISYEVLTSLKSDIKRVIV